MIKQRVLYIGLGGSGIDLGLALDKALKHEICGLDGRQLLQRPGFAEFEPNVIPAFVQYLFIDFAQEALVNAKRILGDRNTTIAQQIVPIIDNYPALAEQMRLMTPSCIDNFIPPRQKGEPSTSPLSAGAGMLPTVGRAAFFNAVMNQGYKETLGSDLERVLSKISGSNNELQMYNNSAVDSVSVYIGFSMSGGTGCGIFYDVLQLLIKELMVHMHTDIISIYPVVFFPSTFDGQLPASQQRRVQLNMAQAILDLNRYVEHRNSPDASANGEFAITYPDPELGTVDTAYILNSPKTPAVVVVQKTGTTLSRKDVERSIAASIVSQVSTLARGENNQSFMEKMVNFPDRDKTHSLGLGTHLLMPMVAAAITLPSQSIADQIAKQIIFEGLDEQQRNDEARESTDAAKEEDQKLQDILLGHCGLRQMLVPEVFGEVSNVSFQIPPKITTPAHLEALINKIDKKISDSMLPLKDQIRKTLDQKTVFRFIDALILTAKEPGVDPYRLVRVANQTLERLEKGVNAVSSNGSSSVKAKSKSKNIFQRVLPKRVSASAVRDAVNQRKEKYLNDVKVIWSNEWAERQNSWAGSVDQGRLGVAALSTAIAKLSEDSIVSVQGLTAELNAPQSGIVNYVPTQGTSVTVALNQLFKDTTARIRQSRNIKDQSPSALLSVLVSSVEGESALARLIDGVRVEAPPAQVQEEILRPVRQSVQSAMRGSEVAGQAGTLPTLGEMLVSTGKDRSSADAVSLLSVLGGLIPDTLIPAGDHKSVSTLVTYPGEFNDVVEKMIFENIALGAKFKSILPPNYGVSVAGKNSIQFEPAGIGDVLTVTISVLGQGLLDNPETRSILKLWAEEVKNPTLENLLWRQRTGWRNINEIFGRKDRAGVVNAVINGLAAGTVEVLEGTLANPTKLLIQAGNNGDSSLTRTVLDINLMEGCSSWPNIVPAFEKLILNIDSLVNFQSTVIQQVLETVPESLQTQLIEIPQVVLTMQDLREGEIATLKSKLNAENRIKFGTRIVREFETALKFWEETYPDALKVTKENYYYHDLATLLSEAKKKGS